MSRWGVIFILLSLSACSTTNNKSISYYHFDIPKARDIAHSNFDKPRLEIRPVILANYLNNRGIAQRVNPHTVVNANWHLWVAQPSKMIDRSTLNLIEKQRPTWFVVGADEAWLQVNKETPERIVKLQIKLERFNGGLENNAELVGSWTLFDHDDKLLKHQNFSESVVLADDGYDGLAKALQKGWERVCKTISNSL